MSELTLDDARRVTTAAEEKALELGCAATITVTDAGGHVRSQVRLDGARFGTLNVSANKAFTAAAFGAPTKVFGGLTQPGQDLFGFADAAGGRIAIFPGGMPLDPGREDRWRDRDQRRKCRPGPGHRRRRRGRALTIPEAS